MTNSINVPIYGKSIFTIYKVKATISSDPVVWSETHISSHGGGGYVHPVHGGHVSAPSVTSSVVQRERYFVKTEDGREIQLNDAVSGRKGHNITIIFGEISNNGGSSLLATYNHETRNYLFEKYRYKKIKWKFFGLTHLTGFIPIESTIIKNILLFFLFNIIFSFSVTIFGLFGIVIVCALLMGILGETVFLEKRIDKSVLEFISD